MGERAGAYVTEVIEATDATGDYLGLSEAGRRLRVSASRVRQLVDQGRLAAKWTPLGRIVLAADVEAEARRRRGGDAPG